MNDHRLTFADDETAAQAESEDTPSRRLPDNYGKLALTEEQRETVYGIQAEYAEQIDALLLQIEELRVERDAAMEAVLTPGQRLRLQELLEEAARARAADEAASSESADPNP